MTIPVLYAFNIGIYALIPFVLTELRPPWRRISFYIYSGSVLILASFLGSIYAFPLFDTVTISGGSIAYAAFMMSVVLLVIAERNISAIRNLIWLTIMVNLVVALIFWALFALVSNDLVIRPFDISPAFFARTLWVTLVGLLLTIGELLLMFVLFERLKGRVSNPERLSALYLLIFVVILMLDGAVFPLLLNGFTSDLFATITNGIASKLIIGLPFCVPIGLYLLLFRSDFVAYSDEPLELDRLWSWRSQALQDEIERQQRILEMSKDQLQRAVERLSISTTSAGIGIWDYDFIEDRFVWDEQMYRLYRVDPEIFEVTLRSWRARIHPDDVEVVLEKALSTLHNDLTYHFPYRIIWPDTNEVRTLEAHAIVLKNSSGRPVRALGVSWDITERIQLQKENSDLQRRYFQAQKMESIGLLAGGISHDFNNLLVPIMGYAELAMMGVDEQSKTFEDLAQIKRAADQAANLTRQILAFSRQKMIERSVVDLHQTILEFQGMIGRLIGEHIELDVSLVAPRPNIVADQGQVEQVLMNLVVNARDAMSDGGVLTLETRNLKLDNPQEAEALNCQLGDYTVLSIVDTGEGMSEAVRARIFEPFFTTKDPQTGTGLGLSTVRDILIQHQGSITVESQLGVGTAIDILLPTAPTEAKVDEAIARPAVSPTQTDPVILVVEDDVSVLQLITSSLITYGYTILSASHPLDAINASVSYSGEIDLLITDSVLPMVDGYELYEQIRRDRPGLKVMYISGYSEDFGIYRKVESNATYFLRKPFELPALIDMVEAALKDADRSK